MSGDPKPVPSATQRVVNLSGTIESVMSYVRTFIGKGNTPVDTPPPTLEERIRGYNPPSIELGPLDSGQVFANWRAYRDAEAAAGRLPPLQPPAKPQGMAGPT